MNDWLRSVTGFCAGLLLAGLPASMGAVEISGNSPDYLMHVWQTEDGLPHNAIRSLAQTRDGYLWVGTRSGGLARFDGVRFVPFNPENTPELRDVEIEQLQLDAQGALWIATGNESITRYHDGQFQLIRRERAEPRWHPAGLAGTFSNSVIILNYDSRPFLVHIQSASNATVRLSPQPEPGSESRFFCQDGQGTLWYLDRRGHLCVLTPEASREFAAESVLIAPPYQDMSVDRSGSLWLAGKQGIARWQNGAFAEETPTNGEAPKSIQRIVAAGSDSLWVCEPARIRRAQNRAWAAAAPPGMALPPGATNSVFGDREGGLWCLSYGEGVFHVRPDGRAQMLTEADGLPSRAVTSWLEDDEGNIWIGTNDGGLVRIRPRRFQVYGPAQGLPGKAVQSVCQDAAGTIWAGTVSGRLARMTSNRFETVSLPLPGGPALDCLTVYPGASGSLWLGSEQAGLFQLQTGNKSPAFQMVQIASQPVRLLMADEAGRLWVGSGGGLRVWQNGQLSTMAEPEGFRSGFGIGAFAQGVAGTIWIGSGPGELWEFRGRRFISHQPPKDWPPARFSTVQADPNGVVWIGTLGGGLIRFENDRFSRITSAQGLPNDFITQLLDDDRGCLWAGTYAGIFKMEKASLDAVARDASNRVACLRFGQFDGLPTLECSGGFFHPAAWRAKDGRLWFATMKGLVSVNPAELDQVGHSPRVRLEELLVDGEPRPFSSSGQPPLQIEPGRHMLQFRFTAFDFTAPDDLRFRWMLEGSEAGWHEGGGERVVSYGRLHPGEYLFRVSAANRGGAWGEPGAVLAFAVQPFFWESWWFKAATVAATFLILILAMALMIRRRHRLELDRLERRSEMERERARIAQDLHDDLGTSLTQIGLLSSLVNREHAPAAEVQSLAREIRSTSRAMVTALNEIVWAVNPNNDSLNELVGYLGNAAEAFFRPGPIRCRLDIPGDLPERPITAEARHGIFLAFKEAINNAAKHSRATEVRVEIRCAGGELQIAITDNGLGFDPAASHAGNGLANMRQRLERLGGSCALHSVPGKATTVWFRLNLDPRA